MKHNDLRHITTDEYGTAQFSNDPASLQLTFVLVPGYKCPSCGGRLVRYTITDTIACKRARCGRGFAHLSEAEVATR